MSALSCFLGGISSIPLCFEINIVTSARIIRGLSFYGVVAPFHPNAGAECKPWVSDLGQSPGFLITGFYKKLTKTK